MKKSLSFDVHYTYTSELQPGIILDSLSGHMDLSEGRYHYNISNTEMIANERYVITLFKEDKIMYLSKPSGTPQADPGQQVLQALKTMGISRCSVDESGSAKAIRINFNSGSAYKEIRLLFDKKSGYLSEMQYVVKTQLLIQATDEQEQVAEKYGEFAVVSCIYSGYAPFVPHPDMFDEHTYFTKEDKEYRAVGTYSDFNVFLGSGDMVSEHHDN